MTQKILVIDDDLFIREIYEEILGQAGFEIDTAVNGKEGLKKLQLGGYDLILLDVFMPELDGISVLRALSDKPAELKNGPIILLTNSSPDSVIEKGLELGASSFFIKVDLTPDQLINKVKEQISK